MKNSIFLAVIIICFTACMSKEGHTNKTESRGKHQITQADSLFFKEGDVVAFRYDSTYYGSGFIDEITKDEGGIWYKVIFADLIKEKIPDINEFRESRVFGRKILSSLNANGYEIGLDGEFINDSCIYKNRAEFILIGQVEPAIGKYLNGSYGVSTEYPDFIGRYKLGLQNRRNPPEDYRDILNSKRTEEYFQLSDFIN